MAGNIALVAEALVFLQAQDVAMPAAVSVLQGGLAGSTVLTRKAAPTLAGDFTPGFRIELHDKDLAIFGAAAREDRRGDAARQLCSRSSPGAALRAG